VECGRDEERRSRAWPGASKDGMFVIFFCLWRLFVALVLTMSVQNLVV
jgi:hypothetical protein